MTTEIENVVENKKKELRDLLASMEQSTPDDAISLADAYMLKNEVGMFQEIGRITRTLHDALNLFQADNKLVELTKVEIPDAKERLKYVITMTEQSANRVLNAVEETMPIAESLKVHAEALHKKWKAFCNREMNVHEFRKMSDEINVFLSGTVDSTATIHRNLSAVILAQDFQDLTGQIIRRVITMVQDVEESLVELVKITGKNMLMDKKMEIRAPNDDKTTSFGPAVPSVDTGSRVKSQDEVDDLLSSLGF